MQGGKRWHWQIPCCKPQRGRQACLTAGSPLPTHPLSPQLVCDNGHNATATGDIADWTTGGALTKVPMVRGRPHPPALAAPACLRTPRPSSALGRGAFCLVRGMAMAAHAGRKHAAADRSMLRRHTIYAGGCERHRGMRRHPDRHRCIRARQLHFLHLHGAGAGPR